MNYQKRLYDRLKQKFKNRVCGSCQACCTSVGVKELNKPPGVRCEHQCQTGCAIYQNRPKMCQIYTCLWLTGNIQDEDLRPDICGLIFDLTSKDERLIVVREIKEFASVEPKNELLIKFMSKDKCIYLIEFDNTRRLIGPPSLCRKIANEVLSRLGK